MAKYTRSYENNIEKHELVFREQIFDFSMLPAPYGREGDKPGLEHQINESFPELEIETLENIGVDMLWCGDEDEVFEILEELGDYE